MHDIRIRHARVRILNITASKREVFGRRTPPSGEPLGAVQLERTKFFRGSADRSPKNGRMRTHISHAQPCIDTALRKCNALLAPDGRLRAMYADTRTRAFWTPWPSQAGLCLSGYVPWQRAQRGNDSTSSDIFRVRYTLMHLQLSLCAHSRIVIPRRTWTWVVYACLKGVCNGRNSRPPL